MSEAIDEYYDVYYETRVLARKQRVCAACDTPIAPGHIYMRVFIKSGRAAKVVKRCLRCQAMHEHLRSLAPGDMWPDEELQCGQDYEDHWDEPPPEEIAELAFLTPDEAQKRFATPKESP